MTKLEKRLLALSAVFLLALGLVTVRANAPLPLRQESAQPLRAPAEDAEWLRWLNEATARELCALPGVGEVIAERIVAQREKQGSFRSVEDLLAVEGIGDKTLEKIYGYLEEN